MKNTTVRSLSLTGPRTSLPTLHRARLHRPPNDETRPGAEDHFLSYLAHKPDDSGTITGYTSTINYNGSSVGQKVFL